MFVFLERRFGYIGELGMRSGAGLRGTVGTAIADMILHIEQALKHLG